LVEESYILENKPPEHYEENMAKCLDWLEFIVGQKDKFINIFHVENVDETNQDVQLTILKACLNGTYIKTLKRLITQ
jgi:hypothetical protein